MIRRLMASTAVLALITAGAWSAQAQTDQTKAKQPAVIEQPAAGTDQGATAAGKNTTATANKAATSSDMASGTNATLTPDQPTLATAFIGRSVYSSDNPDSDNIGDVNDLIIGDNGQITDAVIGVGGFLGIGEKNVAVPFKELKVVESDGDIRLIYSATKEQLQQASAFDRTKYDPRARFQQTQAANQPTGTAAGGLTPAPAAGTNMSANAPAAGTETSTTTTTTASNMTAQPAAKTAAQPAAKTADNSNFLSFNADQVRASTLMGKKLYGPDDKSVGEVSDLVLQEDGKTRAAVVDVGGFLGVGQKRIAIPFDQIQMSQGQNGEEPKLTIAMSKDQLEQAPEWQDRTMGSNQANNANQTTTSTNQQANNTANNTMATGKNGANTQNATTITQDISADRLIGTTVYGNDNDNIGEVGDVVFDKGGAIQAVIVDVGGFLGVGEKPVAVQLDALNVQKDTNGDMKLMINANEDQLKNAPTYDKNASAGGQTTVQ
jgi:sporulation protein YlmC with PRC-barrel domain